MKNKFYTIILVLVALLAIVGMYFAGIRKTSATVYSITDNIVIFEDETGNLWAWNDPREEIKTTDNVILYINDKTTDFFEDDEIVRIKKIGEQAGTPLFRPGGSLKK